MSEESLGDELKDKAADAADKAKEVASDVADDVKEATADIKEEWNKATTGQDGKTVALIAHLTLIGWIIAIIMNSNSKTELGSFYIRQVLGIFLLLFVCSFIPFINFIAWIFFLVVWIMSLIGAVNGSQKPIFLLGKQFQEWFKGL